MDRVMQLLAATILSLLSRDVCLASQTLDPLSDLYWHDNAPVSI